MHRHAKGRLNYTPFRDLFWKKKYREIFFRRLVLQYHPYFMNSLDAHASCARLNERLLCLQNSFKMRILQLRAVRFVASPPVRARQWEKETSQPCVRWHVRVQILVCFLLHQRKVWFRLTPVSTEMLSFMTLLWRKTFMRWSRMRAHPVIGGRRRRDKMALRCGVSFYFFFYYSEMYCTLGWSGSDIASR